ncbi:hypothetical protein BJ508DRAFT_337857 [Ascobolus immersus RN42]|uniref:Uncharacterized protein n=1 Tax=Ascobolus immersus RN42 TaxID=1160509 RepID=A0A3N4I354_ASCIM|nr:hypothetical protein BJ508DRAFT_337857 [Ascobolus immersus RN42]
MNSKSQENATSTEPPVKLKLPPTPPSEDNSGPDHQEQPAIPRPTLPPTPADSDESKRLGPDPPACEHQVSRSASNPLLDPSLFRADRECLDFLSTPPPPPIDLWLSHQTGEWVFDSWDDSTHQTLAHRRRSYGPISNAKGLDHNSFSSMSSDDGADVSPHKQDHVSEYLDWYNKVLAYAQHEKEAAARRDKQLLQFFNGNYLREINDLKERISGLKEQSATYLRETEYLKSQLTKSLDTQRELRERCLRYAQSELGWSERLRTKKERIQELEKKVLVESLRAEREAEGKRKAEAELKVRIGEKKDVEERLWGLKEELRKKSIEVEELKRRLDRVEGLSDVI